MSDTSLLDRVNKLLACPCCGGKLTLQHYVYQCTSCYRAFPIVNQVPILINDKNSLFSVSDFTEYKPTTVNYGKRTAKKIAARLVPRIGINLKTKINYSKLKDLVINHPQPTILIIGSGEIGNGIEQIIDEPKLTIVETDVYFSSRVKIIADGHDLPFQDASFDAVICQAVLEHVLDPGRCVAEIHRVLKIDGLVYAETPFMQQVHMRAYDFTRFTLSGHRYLFRNFTQIDAGMVGGPGMSLAWSILYLFLSFSRSANYQNLCRLILPFFIFWLKYLDYLFVNQPQALDAASGLFFLGRRCDHPISDQEIVQLHWTSKK